ncbi:hypothetical protein KR100_12570 [Synechococcus sp. KORDI-100]|uniref:precorrin-2 C(20)-methyltransferase n=1 Tax=Synechococcus sp. KORDI-100 TaxID=1280380 RepID=UPI0004E04622|nr:precorrin-2 C(20)-methyltransferase [Synechococcus sp. KORDI-100]AII44184.1 hypothetical protein KR100_12570 [Synechococcus sp. KORDI-100]
MAAVRAIEQADLIVSPVARPGEVGMAARIASRWIKPDQLQRSHVFPMVEAPQPRQQAWKAAADLLAGEVSAGKQVVLLCEGDASLFATGSYVLLSLQKRHPSCTVRVIPGIPSFSAAAAAALWPLALQQDQFVVAPCPDCEGDFSRMASQAEQRGQNLALLKLGRRWRWLRPLLEQRGLLSRSLFAEKVGWPDQVIAPAEQIPAGERPYFSLLLIRQCWPEVLP